MTVKTEDQPAVQTLSPRLWLRLVVTYLFIPLILLVCGGDAGWWQAWVFSVLILAAGILSRLWAEGRHPGLLAERAKFDQAPDVKAWDKALAPLMALSVEVLPAPLEPISPRTVP